MSEYVLPQTQRVFDLDFLRANAMNDDDLMAELLGLFMRQSAMLLNQLMDEKDLHRVSEIAHTLKGAANAVGVFQVAAMASALEQCAERGNMDAFSMIDILENRIQEACEILKPLAKVA